MPSVSKKLGTPNRTIRRIVIQCGRIRLRRSLIPHRPVRAWCSTTSIPAASPQTVPMAIPVTPMSRETGGACPKISAPDAVQDTRMFTMFRTIIAVSGEIESPAPRAHAIRPKSMVANGTPRAMMRM